MSLWIYQSVLLQRSNKLDHFMKWVIAAEVSCQEIELLPIWENLEPKLSKTWFQESQIGPEEAGKVFWSFSY